MATQKRMKVKSIAECSPWRILQSFRPSLSHHFLLRHVLLYWLPTCNFCFVEFVNIFIKVRFFTTKKKGPLGPLPWKVMGHILKSWDNDPGPPLIRRPVLDMPSIMIIFWLMLFICIHVWVDHLIMINNSIHFIYLLCCPGWQSNYFTST